MSALIKGLKFTSKLTNRNQAILITSVRNHWNKDFKPAKYPETEKETAAAAKKYNMLPSEYRPYADDGLGYGDYPKLPDTPTEFLDPYYPYDFPELKRNFNEPIHADIDLIGEDRYSIEKPLRHSIEFQYLCFLGVLAGFSAIFYFLENKKQFRPVLPKQYPGDGRKHYTFESN